MSIRPTGPCPAKIMIVGEYPGDQEVAQGEPFVGYAGIELNRMLHEAGIMRSACFITNAIKVKPPGNTINSFIANTKKEITPNHILLRDKFVLPAVRDGLELLKREIEMCQPNLIIALGNVGLWALTGQWGITSWRGSQMETDLSLGLDYQPKVLPVVSPASVLRQWSQRPIAIQDFRKAKKESETRELIRPDYNFVIRPNYDTAVSVLSQLYNQILKGKVKLAVDIETRQGHLTCIGLAWSKLDAICIPLTSITKPDGYWPIEEEAALVFALYQILTHPNCQVVGQGFHYDTQYVTRHWHFTPNLVRDTLLAQHSMFSVLPKSLDFLSSMYCEYHCYWKDEGKGWDPSQGEDQYWIYNCKDAVVTFEVDDAQQVSVDQLGVRELHDFQQALYWPVLETMERGLRVNQSLRADFAFTLQEELAAREQFFIDVLGHPLNPKSPPQMQGLFYKDLGLKPIINRSTGSVSCDDESLRKLADREPIIKGLVNKISEYRSLGVFSSTFVNAKLDIDSRIRCTFKIGGTITYRFASSKNAFNSGMNLQNIPKGGATDDGLDLPNIKTLFIPDPGYSFFDIDLDSADLRIVAWEAELAEMKAMLAEGKKVYVEVMKEFYRDPSLTKEHKQYRVFKGLCHGTHYLGTAPGIAANLGLSVHEVDKIQKWYYGKFPGLKAWQNDVKDQVMKRRMVQNIFGYRCYFFDRIEGNIFNEAIAWIPQSTVACLINRGYMNLYNNCKDVQVLLQVHDSLAGQYPTHLGDWAKSQIIKHCSIELPYKDPTIIPVDIVTSPISWGDCK